MKRDFLFSFTSSITFDDRVWIDESILHKKKEREREREREREKQTERKLLNL